MNVKRKIARCVPSSPGQFHKLLIRIASLSLFLARQSENIETVDHNQCSIQYTGVLVFN